MSTKSERQAAREAVATYHEARLAELIRHVGEAVDRFRAGELDAFETDQILFQYSRAAKELWKFCNLTDVVFTAEVIGERAPADWWERGAPEAAMSRCWNQQKECSSRVSRLVRHAAACRRYLNVRSHR